MPDLLPQLPPRPAPAPTQSAPQQANRSPEPERRDRDGSDAPESFSDTYEAIEAAEKLDTPPQQTENEETADAPVVATLVAAEVQVVPRVLEGETKVELPEVKTPRLPMNVVATAAQTSTPVVAAEAAENTAIANTPQLRPVATATTQLDTEVAPPEVPAPEKPVLVGKTAAPATELMPKTANPQVVPQQLVSVPKSITPTDSTPELPEIEVDPQLPERVGPREPETQQFRAAQPILNVAQQTAFLNVDRGDSAMPVIDELAPMGPQASAAGQPISPLAPGAAPAQIAQHAATQIVAALPRDQGVIITDAGTEISLDPPELGRVRMIVTEVAGGLALTVTAERQETLDLFRKNAQMLAQEFAREGFADTNFAFEGENDRNERSESNGPGLGVADPQDLVETVVTRATNGGGLDLRL